MIEVTLTIHTDSEEVAIEQASRMFEAYMDSLEATGSSWPLPMAMAAGDKVIGVVCRQIAEPV